MEREILNALEAYLDDGLDLDAFQERLVQITWDKDAPKVAYAIELLLAEATSGHRSRAELDAALRELVEQRVSVPVA